MDHAHRRHSKRFQRKKANGRRTAVAASAPPTRWISHSDAVGVPNRNETTQPQVLHTMGNEFVVSNVRSLAKIATWLAEISTSTRCG
jgi:hypothetical protein